MHSFYTLATRLGFVAMLTAISWTATAQSTRLVDYTDVWAEVGQRGPGWGINLVQSSDFVFATFFGYDSAGNPVWYTGELHANNAHAAFSGNVYRTQSAPANNVLSPTNVTIAQVGTATFQPSSATRGTIELRLDQQTLTKDLQRLTLTAPPLQSADTATYAATITTKHETEITHKEETSWSTHTSALTFTKTGSNALLKFIDNNGAACTITGPLEIEGRSYEIDDDFGRYTCPASSLLTPPAAGVFIFWPLPR